MSFITLRRLVIFFSFMMSSHLCAAVEDTLFAKGIASYDQKQYKEAIHIYEDIIKIPFINADVLYNLASAYYRDGQKGKAVAALLAAKNLRPRDPDIKANLKFIHDEGKDQLGFEKDPNQTSLFEKVNFWNGFMNAKEFFYSTLIFFCVGMSSVFLFLWFSQVVLWKIMSIIFLSLSFFFGLGLGSSFVFQESWGATTAAESQVTSGPGEHNTVVFKLREGAPFKLLSQEGEWLKIEISDGRRGWIAKKETSVILIDFL